MPNNRQLQQTGQASFCSSAQALCRTSNGTSTVQPDLNAEPSFRRISDTIRIAALRAETTVTSLRYMYTKHFIGPSFCAAGKINSTPRTFSDCVWSASMHKTGFLYTDISRFSDSIIIQILSCRLHQNVACTGTFSVQCKICPPELIGHQVQNHRNLLCLISSWSHNSTISLNSHPDKHFCSNFIISTPSTKCSTP